MPLPFALTVRWQPSPNHGPRPRAVDTLVLHYTGMPTPASALERMCDPQAEVSAHYMVDEDGSVLQLVEEDRRAWHAGVSEWRGEGDLNSRSIGVEIVNPGHEFGYRPFPAIQMQAVIALCQQILARHPAITPCRIVAHADIAPSRKEDPGELFDWPLLAAAGVGFFPSEADLRAVAPVADSDVTGCLTRLGYPLGPVATDGRVGSAGVEKALIAFQRRYCPTNLSGQADLSTRQMLAAVEKGLSSC